MGEEDKAQLARPLRSTDARRYSAYISQSRNADQEISVSARRRHRAKRLAGDKLDQALRPRLIVLDILLAMSLIDAPSFKSSSSPIRSTSLPAGAYVLSIASTPSFYAASASSPSNAIHLFDKARLQNVQTLAGHESAITTLRTVPNVANAVNNALLSSGKDGSVKVWDERSGSVALRCEHQP